MSHVQTTSPATTTRVTSPRAFGRWMVTFAGFPLGGYAAYLTTGRVDSLVPALLGGLITGAVLGAVQAWGLGRNRPPVAAWIVATALGMMVGLGIGSALVDYGTSLSDLVPQGAVTGLAVGLAQGFVLLPRLGRLALAWPAFLTAAWAAGWAVTTADRHRRRPAVHRLRLRRRHHRRRAHLVLPAALNRTAARKEIQS